MTGAKFTLKRSRHTNVEGLESGDIDGSRISRGWGTRRGTY